MRARPIKFTRNYGSFHAKGEFGESLELCASILKEVVKIPAKCETIYVVPLKRPTADTIKLEDLDPRESNYLVVDGKKTEFVFQTSVFIRAKFLNQGTSYFRIEY